MGGGSISRGGYPFSFFENLMLCHVGVGLIW